MLRRSLVGIVVAVAVAATALSAGASAPPVGPLPQGPTTTIRVQHGQLFALALARPAAGFAWRGARPSNPDVARPLNEGEVYGNIVLVYRAVHPGKTTLVYALTKGEGYKAYAARFVAVTVF